MSRRRGGAEGRGWAARRWPGVEVREVFDLPPVQLVVTEHRAQPRECGCGQVTTAPFPAEAVAPAYYGPGVAALGAYLLGRQHLPVARAAEFLADALGAPVSTGWVAGLLLRAAAGLQAFTSRTRDALQHAAVAHFNETGARVAGTLHWVHGAGTQHLTLLHLDRRRGKTAIVAAGVLPGFAGVAVHDGLPAYRQYEDAVHGLCNAHHLRELAGMAEAIGQAWLAQLGRV